MQSIPFEVCGSNMSKAVKSLSALSSAILLTNQTDRPTERPTPSPLPLTCALARPASSQPGFTSTAEGGGGRATTTQRRSARYAYAGCGRTNRVQAAPTRPLEG